MPQRERVLNFLAPIRGEWEEIMKIALGIALLLASITAAMAQYGSGGMYGSSGSGLYGTGSNPSSHYVQPYTTSNGTSVQGHYQTNPNGTQMDNYGTRGNVNPYTGQVGTRTPHY
jgi:hypothetical protein